MKLKFIFIIILISCAILCFMFIVYTYQQQYNNLYNNDLTTKEPVIKVSLNELEKEKDKLSKFNIKILRPKRLNPVKISEIEEEFKWKNIKIYFNKKKLTYTIYANQRTFIKDTWTSLTNPRIFVISDEGFDYLLVETTTGGSGGAWKDYKIYSVENSKIAPVENLFLETNYDIQNIFFVKHKDFILIKSNSYGKAGAGCSWGYTDLYEINKQKVIDHKIIQNPCVCIKQVQFKGIIPSTSTVEECIDYPYPISLIVKNGKLFLEIENGFIFYIPAGEWFQSIQEAFSYPSAVIKLNKYYLLESGKIQLASSEFASYYRKVAEKYNNVFEKQIENLTLNSLDDKTGVQWEKMQLWLSPLLTKTVALILLGEENKAWQTFKSEFEFSVEPFSSQIKRIFSEEKIHEEIMKQLKRLLDP